MIQKGVGLYFISFILMIMLTLLIPMVLFLNYGTTMNVNLTLSWSIIAISGTMLCYHITHGKKRIIDLTFYIFVFVWFGFITFLQIMTNTFPHEGGHYSDDEIRFVFFLVILGIIFYEIGKYAVRLKTKDQNSYEGLQIALNPDKFYYIGIFSILFSLAIVMSIGGPTALFDSRQQLNGQFGDKTTFLVLNTLMRVPIFVSLLIGIHCMKTTIEWRKPKLWFMLIIVFIWNSIVNNFISSPRYWLGSIVISLMFLIFKWKRSSFTKWTISFLAMLLFIFPYADLFRHTTNADKMSVFIQSNNKIKELATDGDYEGFQMVLNTVKYSNIYGYSYGKQFLVSILFFVPRSVWPDKPYGTGQTVATHMGYGFTNLACPLWAEGYNNFGISGVIGLFLLYGIFVETLQKRYMSGTASSYLKVFVPFFAAYQIFLLRGELLSGVAYLVPFAVTLWIFFLLINQKKAKRKSRFKQPTIVNMHRHSV